MKVTNYQVLIIDDSPEDRYVFGSCLSDSTSPSFSLTEATTGKEGLAQCKRLNPDCILLDHNLPDMNGIEFLSHLQNQFGANSPAVVVLTGQGNERHAVEALKAGAHDYLVKGLAQNRMCQAISAAVESVRLRKQGEPQAPEAEMMVTERENPLSN